MIYPQGYHRCATQNPNAHLFGRDLLPRSIIFQNATFDHDLHTIDRDTRYFIDGLLEYDRELLDVEVDIVRLARMLDVDWDRRHGRYRQGENKDEITRRARVLT